FNPVNNNNARNGTLNNGDFESIQNARKDLIGELEAIIQYDDHLHKTGIPIAGSTWENIRNEELVHVGELLGLLSYLAPYQKQFVEQGWNEFQERLKG
ncbi:MAG: ubiquinone biosynthesis protein COQ7, partial [Candidatus Gallimonas sp.]